MIRRGLQIVIIVGITALGAAPSYANLPIEFFMNGWGPTDLDGRYHSNTPGHYALGPWIADRGYPNQGTIYARLTPEGGWDGEAAIFWNVTENQWQFTGGNYDEIFLGGEENTLFSELTSGSFGVIPGDVFSDPVDFPAGLGFDPLRIGWGFSFAMSFWAVAVAASIAMRWVKDLASAAT